MIIFFPAGQLGNQFFQYSFIETRKKNKEMVISSYCDFFEISDTNRNDYCFVGKFIRFPLRRVLTLLCTLRLISSVRPKEETVESHVVETSNLQKKRGLFSSIAFVDGFYQSEKLCSFLPKLKEQFLENADRFLQEIPEGHTKVFVHIRRGDYLEWSVLGKKDPSLPFKYYETLIHWFIQQHEKVFFIFLSNDASYVEEKFDWVDNKLISRNDVGTDLAIMMRCSNGVLSNSTLSWWGARLMTEKEKLFAPKYWLGWKSNTWFPKDIACDDMTFIDVKDEA